MSTITEEKIKTESDTTKKNPYKLILHNDDYNTFDHVISSLIQVCNHTFEQASQSAHIIHFSGECTVKNGDFDTISDMKETLVLRGLLATMES